jgi:hypothetical protein
MLVGKGVGVIVAVVFGLGVLGFSWHVMKSRAMLSTNNAAEIAFRIVGFILKKVRPRW